MHFTWRNMQGLIHLHDVWKLDSSRHFTWLWNKCYLKYYYYRILHIRESYLFWINGEEFDELSFLNRRNITTVWWRCLVNSGLENSDLRSRTPCPKTHLSSPGRNSASYIYYGSVFKGVLVFVITKTKTPKFTVKFYLKLGGNSRTEDNLTD